jgi:hypothetical protein
MLKWISPLMIFGRKKSFCSSVPNRMMVGPTVLIVSMGTGAPARIDSSKKMNCSRAERPWPPYSFGHPIPSQPSAPIWRTTLRIGAPTPPPSPSSSRTSGVSNLS